MHRIDVGSSGVPAANVLGSLEAQKEELRYLLSEKPELVEADYRRIELLLKDVDPLASIDENTTVLSLLASIPPARVPRQKILQLTIAFCVPRRFSLAQILEPLSRAVSSGNIGFVEAFNFQAYYQHPLEGGHTVFSLALSREGNNEMVDYLFGRLFQHGFWKFLGSCYQEKPLWFLYLTYPFSIASGPKHANQVLNLLTDRETRNPQFSGALLVALETALKRPPCLEWDYFIQGLAFRGVYQVRLDVMIPFQCFLSRVTPYQYGVTPQTIKFFEGIIPRRLAELTPEEINQPIGNTGKNLLDCAVEEGQTSLVYSLLERGADTSSVGKDLLQRQIRDIFNSSSRLSELFLVGVIRKDLLICFPKKKFSENSLLGILQASIPRIEEAFQTHWQMTPEIRERLLCLLKYMQQLYQEQKEKSGPKEGYATLEKWMGECRDLIESLKKLNFCKVDLLVEEYEKMETFFQDYVRQRKQAIQNFVEELYLASEPALQKGIVQRTITPGLLMEKDLFFYLFSNHAQYRLGAVVIANSDKNYIFHLDSALFQSMVIGLGLEKKIGKFFRGAMKGGVQRQHDSSRLMSMVLEESLHSLGSSSFTTEERQEIESIFQEALGTFANAVILKTVLEDSKEQEHHVLQVLVDLLPGQLYGVDLGWYSRGTFSGHACFGTIEKNAEGSFRLTFYNTGGSTSDYHHQWENTGCFQTFLVFDKVPQEDILGVFHIRNRLKEMPLEAHLTTNNWAAVMSQKLYAMLGEICQKGVKLPASEHREDYEQIQAIGSCAWQSKMAFLRHRMMQRKLGSITEKLGFYKALKAFIFSQMLKGSLSFPNLPFREYVEEKIQKYAFDLKLLELAKQQDAWEEIVKEIEPFLAPKQALELTEATTPYARFAWLRSCIKGWASGQSVTLPSHLAPFYEMVCFHHKCFQESVAALHKDLAARSSDLSNQIAFFSRLPQLRPALTTWMVEQIQLLAKKFHLSKEERSKFECLLRHLDPSVQVGKNQTLLSWIASSVNNFCDLIALCFTHKISDEVKKEALYLAIRKGNYSFVQAIGSNYCLECRFADGHTPLSLAMEGNTYVLEILVGFQLSQPPKEGLLKEIYQGKPLWFSYLMHGSKNYMIPDHALKVLDTLTPKDLTHPDFPGVLILNRVLTWHSSEQLTSFIQNLVAKDVYQVQPDLLVRLHARVAKTEYIWEGSMDYADVTRVYTRDLSNPVFRRIEELSVEELNQPGSDGKTVLDHALEKREDDIATHLLQKGGWISLCGQGNLARIIKVLEASKKPLSDLCLANIIRSDLLNSFTNKEMLFGILLNPPSQMIEGLLQIHLKMTPEIRGYLKDLMRSIDELKKERQKAGNEGLLYAPGLILSCHELENRLRACDVLIEKLRSLSFCKVELLIEDYQKNERAFLFAHLEKRKEFISSVLQSDVIPEELYGDNQKALEKDLFFALLQEIKEPGVLHKIRSITQKMGQPLVNAHRKHIVATMGLEKKIGQFHRKKSKEIWDYNSVERGDRAKIFCCLLENVRQAIVSSSSFSPKELGEINQMFEKNLLTVAHAGALMSVANDLGDENLRKSLLETPQNEPCGLMLSWRSFPIGHSMFGTIEKNSEGLCRVTIYNTGAGINFHPRWKNTGRYQTFLIFDRVPYEDIIGFSHLPSLFSSKAESGMNSNKFYALLEEMCQKGVKLPASENEEDYEQIQTIGSCIIQSLMAFFRHRIMESKEGSPAEKLGFYKAVKAFTLQHILKDSLGDLNPQLKEYAEEKIQKYVYDLEILALSKNEVIWDEVMPLLDEKRAQEFRERTTLYARFALLRSLVKAWAAENAVCIPPSLEAIVQFHRKRLKESIHALHQELGSFSGASTSQEVRQVLSFFNRFPTLAPALERWVEEHPC